MKRHKSFRNDLTAMDSDPKGFISELFDFAFTTFLKLVENLPASGAFTHGIFFSLNALRAWAFGHMNIFVRTAVLNMKNDVCEKAVHFEM